MVRRTGATTGGSGSDSLSMMEATLPPEPVLPLVDKLTDALVTGQARPVGMPADGEPWDYWSCSIERGDDGYAISEWRVDGQLSAVEGPEPIRLEDSLSELLTFCVEQGLTRPEEIQVFFNRGPEVQLSVEVVTADGTEVACDLDRATEPALQHLHQRWGSESARRGQALLRDPEVWWAHLEDEIAATERRITKGRVRLIASLEADDRETGAAAASAAEDGMLRRYLRLFRDRYTRGADADELRDVVESWYQDTTLAFTVLEQRAGTAQFTDPLHGREYVAVWDTVNLLISATLLGREDIARDILAHPAISHAPYRAVDVLALIHGVPQASGLEDMRMDVWKDRDTHEPWLKLFATAPGRRQAALETFVRNWPATLEKTRRPEQWCVEAALFAVVFDLDDSTVRDEKWYPADLADYARDLGVQPLPAKTKLPGLWKKPTPPKVLEPADQREPHVFRSATGDLAISDFAALAEPVGSEVASGTFDEVLDRGLAAGTVIVFDGAGVEPQVHGPMVQEACGRLGLRVPGKLPPQVPRSSEAAMKRFDEWLEPLGVRLLHLDLDEDAASMLPVLAEDYAALVGRTVAGVSLRPARTAS